MSLGDRFCVSRKGGIGESRWVQLKGANSNAMFGLTCRKALICNGRTISFLLVLNGLRNELSHFLGSLFPVFKVRFQLGKPGWKFLNWWVWVVTCLLRMAEITSGRRFKHNNWMWGGSSDLGKASVQHYPDCCSTTCKVQSMSAVTVQSSTSHGGTGRLVEPVTA